MRTRLRVITAAGVAAATMLASTGAASAAPEMAQFSAPVTGTSDHLVPKLAGDAGYVAGGANTSTEYAREPGGLDSDNTTYLRAEMWYDPATYTANTTLPAVVLFHGGLVNSPTCMPSRRAGMRAYARELAARGYLVYNVDFRPVAASGDVQQDALIGLAFALQTGGTYRGDCIPDNAAGGWGPGIKSAQVSAQLAVRSFKYGLRRYAQTHTGAAATKFTTASQKVVAMGVSLGGHLAARLATRRDEGDAGGTEAWRRVSGAVGISALGECTPGQSARTFDKVGGAKLTAWPTLDKVSAPFTGRPNAPFSTCDAETPAAGDAPMQFHNATTTSTNLCDSFRVECSQLGSTVSGWSSNIGWDRVIDARWPASTCTDVNAVAGAGACTATRYRTGMTHTQFPGSDFTTGIAKSIMDATDTFFRSPSILPYTW